MKRGHIVPLQVYLLNPVENLRSYINNRPPLVIFMISVSAVAIAFLTIGYFFKIKEIRSPELTEVSEIVFFFLSFPPGSNTHTHTHTTDPIKPV